MSTIFIFRRDLRLPDNKGLIYCLKNIKQPILPIFILTPEQLTNQNMFKSNNAIQFMMESLIDLNEQLKTKNSRLRFFYGHPTSILDYLLNKLKKVNTVITNLDYTPYSVKRDDELYNICKKYNVKFVLIEDYLLQPLESVLTNNNEIYIKYTPYWKKVNKKSVDKPILNLTGTSNDYWSSHKTISKELKITSLHKFYKKNKNLLHSGGRNSAISQLKLVKQQNIDPGYNIGRDCLNRKTTELSAYIKFGCISIREVYWHFKNVLKENSKDLIKELYWRDFYANVVWAYPRVLEGQLQINANKSLKLKYDKIKWRRGEKAKRHFNLWCQGKTGFPIVDAAMTQMNITGYMHNRCRMIVSSFLIKTLLIDWRLGEMYFARQLYDYDPSSNNQGWQFSSSSGADSQPYFRIFNPWRQSKKYDPNCEYIKHWIPQLKNVANNDIHKWNEVFNKYLKNDIDYYQPIVDYSIQRKISLKMYKKALK